MNETSCKSTKIAQYLHKKACLFTWIQGEVQFFVADTLEHTKKRSMNRLRCKLFDRFQENNYYNYANRGQIGKRVKRVKQSCKMQSESA